MLDKSYKNWLIELKQKVRATQIKASLAVNATLIEFYFDLGKKAAVQQTAWSTGFIKQLSLDLRNEFPKMEGFSETNLKYCRLFFQYLINGPQVDDQLLLNKFKH